MIINSLVVFLTIAFMWLHTNADETASWPSWACDPDIGRNQTGTSRTCAVPKGKNVIYTNAWEPNNKYICFVGTTTQNDVNCSDANPLPWKYNLAPGDHWDSGMECYNWVCSNLTSTCVGKQINETCIRDLEWDVGLSCNNQNNTCMPTVQAGMKCTENIKCGFGLAWVNSTCFSLSSFQAGEYFTIQDNEMVPFQFQDNSDFAARACKTFAAVKTTYVDPFMNLPLYMCTNGFKPEFESYASTEVRDCTFSLDYGNGTQIESYLHLPSVCGYNRDNQFYCPMRRNNRDHDIQNEADSKTWKNAPRNCHIRSSIQYCQEIMDNPLQSLAFRNAMKTSWLTFGKHYALVANSNRCIGEAVMSTANFWRLVGESETDTSSEFFTQISY